MIQKDNNDRQKKQYKARQFMTVGGVGQFSEGDILDSEQLPASTLQDLVDAGYLDYVGTVAFNKHGNGGQGSWDAVPEPPVPDPAKAKAAEGKGQAEAVPQEGGK